MYNLPEPLSPDEERLFIDKLGGCEDKDAKNVLMERNLRLVVHIAKKFNNVNIDPDDLFSIGAIGLIKAVNTFKPNKNFKLSTYASRCISNEILTQIRRNKRMTPAISLDAPLSVDFEGNELSPSDVLRTGDDETAQTVMAEAERVILLKAVAERKDRDRRIIKMRFALGENYAKKMTQKEIAESLEMPQSYISRLEKKIYKLLQKKNGWR